MENHESASIVRRLLKSEYFSSVSDYDRVFDAELYEVEGFSGDGQWDDDESEALRVFSHFTDEERADALDLIDLFESDRAEALDLIDLEQEHA